MFILNCQCGNEIWADEEDDAEFWQCEICGEWYNYFGQIVQKHLHNTRTSNINDEE